MKNLIRFLPFLLLPGALWLACRKDDFPAAEPTAEVAFAGRVTDENGQALAGAGVRAGGAFTQTDENGLFRLPAVRLAARDAKITVNKIGYFDLTRSFVVKDGATKIVDIQLLARTQVATLTAGQGGTANIAGGAALNFPANALSKSGQAYTGVVRVFARYLDPMSPQLFSRMPGDLRAIDAGGAETGLVTFGMLAVELTDGAGQPLQVASGSEVEIRMPIQPEQQASAPAEIPLWWFDEDKSRWIEEGSAQRVGNEYVGKVRHFSWWNCDIPGPIVQLSGSVSLNTGQPLAGVHVWVCPVGSGLTVGCGHGLTDANGQFSGGVPQGVPLQITIQGIDCNTTAYTAEIGSFDVDATLPPIIVTPPGSADWTLSGTLTDCTGQPVDNGYVRIQAIGGVQYFDFTDDNGHFSYTFYCPPPSGNLSVVGYDMEEALQTAPLSVNSNLLPEDVGELAACDNVQEFIFLTLDGEDFSFFEPTASYSAPNTWAYAFAGNKFVNFGFANNGQTGEFPITYFATEVDSLNTPPDITTNVSAFGDVGEPVIGTFGGTYQSNNGASHTVSGSYRILRE